MPGYNLQTMKDQLLWLLENSQTSDSSAVYTDVLLFRMLAEAQRKLQERLRLGATISSAKLDLVSGVWAYDLPLDVMRETLERVRLYGTDAVWRDLRRLKLSQVPHEYDSTGAGPGTSSEPSQWALDERNRKILLIPKPNRSATDALSLTYTPEPGVLHRLYVGRNETASVYHGHRNVTLTGILPEGTVLPGDEFGIMPSEQSDGTAISDQSPLLWSEIEEVSEEFSRFTFRGQPVQHGYVAIGSLTTLDWYQFLPVGGTSPIGVEIFTCALPAFAGIPRTDPGDNAGSGIDGCHLAILQAMNADGAQKNRINNLVAGSQYNFRDYSGGEDRIVLYEAGKLPFELDEIADYIAGDTQHNAEQYSHRWWALAAKLKAYDDVTPTPTTHYFSTSHTPWKRSYDKAAAALSDVWWQRATTVRYHFSESVDLSDVVDGSATLRVTGFSDPFNNGVFTITAHDDAGEWVEVNMPSRTSTIRDQTGQTGPSGIVNTDVAGKKITLLNHEGLQDVFEYHLAPNGDPYAYLNVQRVTHSGNVSKFYLSGWPDLSTTRLVAGDTLSSYDPGRVDATYDGNGTLVEGALSQFYILGFDNVAKTIDVYNPSGLAEGSISAAAVGSFQHPLESAIWQSGATVRFTFLTPLDLSDVVNGVTELISTGFSNSENNGTFLITAHDDDAKWVEATTGSSRSSDSLDEGALLPVDGAFGAIDAPHSYDLEAIVYQATGERAGQVRVSFVDFPALIANYIAGDYFTVASAAQADQNGTFEIASVDQTNKYVYFTNALITSAAKNEGSDTTRIASLTAGAAYAGPNIGIPLSTTSADQNRQSLYEAHMRNPGRLTVRLEQGYSLEVKDAAGVSTYYRFSEKDKDNKYAQIVYQDATAKTVAVQPTIDNILAAWSSNDYVRFLTGQGLTVMRGNPNLADENRTRTDGYFLYPDGYNMTVFSVTLGNDLAGTLVNLKRAIEANSRITLTATISPDSDALYLTEGDGTIYVDAQAGANVTASTAFTSKTTLLLREPWVGPTVAGASYICAQVPDLARWAPGQIGLDVLPNYAAALILQDSGKMEAQVRAQGLLNLVESEVRRVTQDEPADAPNLAQSAQPTLTRGY